jgi:serine/threonine protein kinase
MNYKIKKVDFEISNLTSVGINIIGSYLKVHQNKNQIIFKIIKYIGKGSVGKVYMIESVDNLKVFVIKISNPYCEEDLINEIELIESYFEENKIIYPSYPVYYGFFKKLECVGAIYPFVGFYNLEKIKSIDYKIGFTHNIQIIKQLIDQMIGFKNILHCDIKSSNIVIDIKQHNITTTIIDFGLMKSKQSKNDIISTNYITSPESLLTNHPFNVCLVDIKDLNLEKHDYYGLFTVIINLFVKKSFWSYLYQYLIDLNFNNEFIRTHESSSIYVYVWFKFFYKNKSYITNKSLFNLIEHIESIYQNISLKNFLDYDSFFEVYIINNINYNAINKLHITNLKNFTKLLIQFDSLYRPELSELKSDCFLN